MPTATAVLAQARAAAADVTMAQPVCGAAVWSVTAVPCSFDPSMPIVNATNQVAPEVEQRRGRARMNALVASAAGAPAGSEMARRQSALEQAGEYRRTKLVRAQGAVGAADFGR